MQRLPYAITFLFPLQSILAALGLRYALYGLLVGATAAFLLRAAVVGRSATGFTPVWLFLTYVAVAALARPGLVALYGFLGYAQFALLWLGYLYAYGRIDLEALTRTNLRVATLVAVIGTYQYFFNPTLWGFSTYVGVEAMYTGRELRINSVMPSAMTLGAYLVISALLGLTLSGRKVWTSVAVATCLAAAFLTGNKSTVFALGVAVMYGLVDRGIRRHGLWGPLLYLSGAAVVYVVLLAAVGVWGPWLAGFNATLFRAVAPFFFTGETGEVSYLLAYWGMLFVFYGGGGIGAAMFGNGLGLTRQNTTFFGGDALGDFLVAESFLVQVLFEVGVVGLLLLHVVLWRAFRRARAERTPGRIGYDHVLAALYANMIVVHVFSGVYLGFVWAYVVALLSERAEPVPPAVPEIGPEALAVPPVG